ncbi:Galactosylgalactosylxylosylprotein 3-beta-glucuronosyltransferase 2 [Agyrium rufum]|nr:Galactosylgalactosylxylosylprotein 3-beta-glucuronosyltransferase 2 [Agyrium rufum]
MEKVDWSTDPGLKARQTTVHIKATHTDSSSATSSEGSRHGSIDTPRNWSRKKRKSASGRGLLGRDDDDDYSFSDYSDYPDTLHSKHLTSKFRRSRLNNRIHRYLPALAVGFILIITYLFLTTSRGRKPRRPNVHTTSVDRDHHEAFFSDLYKRNEAGPGAFPLSLQNALPSDLCSICDCHASPAFYAPSVNYAAELAPRPHMTDIYPGPDKVDMNEFMRQTILDMYCARQHLSTQQALKLVRRSGNHLDEMMSWSLEKLKFNKPTIYLTTATSPNGKAGDVRPQYFRRSGRAIRTWMTQQEAKVHVRHPGWQVVWIIAEDEVDIDPLVVRTLRRTGVPYIYFAYGLTKSWGNAQKNAVMQMVYALSRPEERGGLLGSGPVYGLDDDNKILPDLLDLLIRVERIGVVPVGNLGATGFEAPIINELGEIIQSESLWQFRKYAFDYGGFSFNSSLLGTAIAGPMFWKHNDFAGESEFLEQVIGNIRDLEPLCGRQSLQDCHFVWHNEPLLTIERMTDDEEIAYVQKFGAERLFQELGLQARESEKRKADEYRPPGSEDPAPEGNQQEEEEEEDDEEEWVEDADGDAEGG